jgi:hypothetical protein
VHSLHCLLAATSCTEQPVHERAGGPSATLNHISVERDRFLGRPHRISAQPAYAISFIKLPVRSFTFTSSLVEHAHWMKDNIEMYFIFGFCVILSTELQVHTTFTGHTVNDSILLFLRACECEKAGGSEPGPSGLSRWRRRRASCSANASAPAATPPLL